MKKGKTNIGSLIERFNKNKYWILPIFCVLLILIVFFIIKYVRTDKPDDDVNPTGNPFATQPVVSDIPIPDVNEITIYTISPSDGYVRPLIISVYDEVVTPALIVELVTDAMEDENYYITVLEVTTGDSTVIVDLSSDSPPCHNIEGDLEEAILDAFAQSILDNLDDYDKVVFWTDGDGYKSDNRAFPKDYVYKGK